MLSGGAGPKKCRLLLIRKYKNDTRMIALMPDELQLKNRKATLKRNKQGGWHITNCGALLEWASPKMCESAVDFYGCEMEITDASLPNEHSFHSSVSNVMDEMIVLQVFPDTANASFGVIFTSRQTFQNLRRTMHNQASEVFASTNGTYKLHEGGWTLVNFGTYMTRYERGKFSKHFVPWTFMFVKSESEFAYHKLFGTTREFGKTVFGVDLQVKFGSLDHCATIANAYRAEWPGVNLLSWVLDEAVAGMLTWCLDVVSG